MGDILSYFIKKSDLQKNEYFEYRNKNKEKTEKKSFSYTKLNIPVYDNYVVFDLETTGFSAINNKIIEIGAVKIENNQIIATFNTLINPRVYIPPYIEQKIHITNDMVSNKPYIEEALPQFLDFIEDIPLVAHNASFDMSFLVANAESLGYIINNPAIDTLALSRKTFPDIKSHKLSSLCEHFNIELSSAHRAYYDALATYEVYKKILENI